MRNQLVPAFAALLICSCALHTRTAHADTYSFTVTTPPGAANALTASGTFTTDSSGPVQNILSLTGTAENGALTGDSNPVTLSLIPVQPGNSAMSPSVKTYDTGNGSAFYLYYDNLFTPGAGTAFDFNGIGVLSSDGVGYEIGSDGTNYAYEAFNNSIGFDQLTYGANNVPLDIAIIPTSGATVTPEPSSVALLGTGLLGVAGVVRRRFQA